MIKSVTVVGLGGSSTILNPEAIHIETSTGVHRLGTEALGEICVALDEKSKE